MSLPSLNKELTYGSKLHNFVRDEIRARYKMSYNAMSQKWKVWNKVDQGMGIYLSPEELARKECDRKDNDFEIKVGFSWALHQTALMYYTSVFLGRAPIFQYTGRHGEGQNQVLAMEALINYQIQVGGSVPSLYGWLSDQLAYGVGVVGEYWDETTIHTARYTKKPKMAFGLPVEGEFEKQYEEVDIPGYMGNRIFNTRVYDFFPDPRVPISQLQKGEFVGRMTQGNHVNILKRGEKGIYFNTDIIHKHASATKGLYDYNESKNESLIAPDRDDYQLGSEKTRNNTYDLLEMTVDLIPNLWGLGESGKPQKWVFTLLNEEVVIGCRPLGLFHDRFPFHVGEYEIDMHSLSPRGMIEISEPMNEIMSWMINSHVYNVRKNINSEYVVDPYKVVMSSFQRKNSGRLIKLSAAAYGTDPKDAIHQLTTNDVTRQHIQDAKAIKDMMQMIMGINDSLMGAMNTTGRKTATEVRTSSTMGINRLKMGAEFSSAMGWDSLSHNLVASSQQLYDAERKFKIAGNNIEGEEFIDVNPEKIAGFFDFVPVDGTLPVDRTVQSNLFKELLLGMGKINPQMLMEYDMNRIMDHIMKLEGIKNLSSFKVQVMPDQQIQQEVQNGNLVGIGSSMGGNPAEAMPKAV